MFDVIGMLDRPQLFFGMACAGIPIYIFLGSRWWDDWDDFLDCLRLWYQPVWLSALRGEHTNDAWEALRLLVFVVACIAVASGLYLLAKRVI